MTTPFEASENNKAAMAALMARLTQHGYERTELTLEATEAPEPHADETVEASAPEETADDVAPDPNRVLSDARGRDLLAAVVGNEADRVKQLLQDNCNPNVRNAHGWSPLHFCAQHNHADLARLLLHYHADVNAQANDGCSPLHVAGAFDNLEVVQVLTEDEHVDVNLIDNRGNTPWHIVREDELPNRWAIIALLKAKSAKPSLKNFADQRPGQTAFKKHNPRSTIAAVAKGA